MDVASRVTLVDGYSRASQARSSQNEKKHSKVTMLAQAPPKVGDVIDGRYALNRLLGEGAEGMVFEAVQLFTDQRVAIKVLRLGTSPSDIEQQRARLRCEARVLGKLRHPNVVSILDANLAANSPFLVLELLEGRTLDGLIAARGRLEVVEAVNVLLQVGAAVAFAHKCGVMHRDVKPSNVIVAIDQVVGERVKLVDFGTSKCTDRDGLVTAVGALVGTPAYMAPEQLMACPDIDARVDVYSLGAVLFECLTGRVVHEGNYAQIVRAAFSGESPSIAALSPTLSPALARVVQRAISHDREQRQATVAQLIEELRLACPEATGKTTFLRRQDDAARRRFARAPFSGPAHLVLAGGAIDGQVQDVSEGGMLFLALSACDVDQRGEIRFTLPIEGLVATCPVHVRWVRGAERVGDDRPRIMGLEFIDAPDELRRSIGRYVALMSGVETPVRIDGRPKSHHPSTNADASRRP